MCHVLFQWNRLPRLCLWVVTTLQTFDYPRSSSFNSLHSIDTHFQDGTGSVSVLFEFERQPISHLWMAATNSHWVLQRKVAITSVMDSSDQVTLQIPYLQDWTSFTLRWHLCLGWGRESDTIILIWEAAMTSLWMAATYQHLGYRRCTAKNRWRSLEGHF
jgi:hypothetical protein